jgi:hypothetical protein
VVPGAVHQEAEEGLGVLLEEPVEVLVSHGAIMFDQESRCSFV